MPKILINVLSSVQVHSATPGRYVDGNGLHLLVRKSGARSWVFRFMVDGRSRDVGLGSAGKTGVSLSEARKICKALRHQVESDVNPLV